MARKRGAKGGRPLNQTRKPRRHDAGRGWRARLRGTPWLTVLVVFGGVWLIYFATAWSSFTPTPLPLKLAIDKAGSTRVVYGTTPVSLISPACGCARDESTNWRGISFLTRRFELSPPRAAGFDAAVFTVFAPFPGSFDYLPNQFRLKVVEYDVAMPAGSPLSIRVSREGPPQTSSEAIVTLVRRGDPHLYFFATRGPVTFETTGPLPVGAWIPLKDSIVELSSRTDPRGLGTTTYSLVERYGPDPHVSNEDAQNTDRFEAGYPAVDFIGPVIWGWSRVPPEEAESDGRDHYAVTRIETPYAARIVAEPSNLDEREHRVYPPRRVGGSVSLTFVKTEADITAYEALRSRIANNPIDITTVQNLQFTSSDGAVSGGPTFMTMTAPPAPLSDGFNAFGDIQSLAMSNADGSVMIGASRWEFRNAALSLARLSKFVRDGIGSSLPIQMDGDAIRSTGQFGAVGTVEINGESITTPTRKWEEFRSQMDLVALLAGLAGALITFLTWAWGRFWRPSLGKLR